MYYHCAITVYTGREWEKTSHIFQAYSASPWSEQADLLILSCIISPPSKVKLLHLKKKNEKKNLHSSEKPALFYSYIIHFHTVNEDVRCVKSRSCCCRGLHPAAWYWRSAEGEAAPRLTDARPSSPKTGRESTAVDTQRKREREREQQLWKKKGTVKLLVSFVSCWMKSFLSFHFSCYGVYANFWRKSRSQRPSTPNSESQLAASNFFCFLYFSIWL